MRIAICFYGLVGSRVNKNGEGEDLDPKVAYKYYKEFILNNAKDKIDIFIHTWSIDHKKELLKIYNPKLSVFEEQKQFKKSLLHPDIKKFKSIFNLKNLILKFLFVKKYHSRLEMLKKQSFRAYSRWYSNKRVLELMNTYQSKEKIMYDCVMVTRLDIGFFKKINFHDLELSNFYAGYRNNAPNKKNNFKGDYENELSDKEFNDLWFISNSRDMIKFSKLFDLIENYNISPHKSSFQHVNKYVKPKKIEYLMYRWFDFELIRRKLYDSKN